MKLTFAPKGILQIDDARIVFRNFEGRASKYNRQGDRNFALVIDDEEIAEALKKDGWNIRIKPPKEEGDIPFMYMLVKVKFNNYGPKVYLKTGDRKNRLNEDTVSCLDDVSILRVDLDIRPYDWEMSDGKSGRTAYLQAICVEQEVDRFAGDQVHLDVPSTIEDELPW